MEFKTKETEERILLRFLIEKILVTMLFTPTMARRCLRENPVSSLFLSLWREGATIESEKDEEGFMRESGRGRLPRKGTH
jgi:hypothetical protein